MERENKRELRGVEERDHVLNNDDYNILEQDCSAAA